MTKQEERDLWMRKFKEKYADIFNENDIEKIEQDGNESNKTMKEVLDDFIRVSEEPPY